MTPYRQREIGNLVRSALADLPVVVVTGLRQAGKSTFLQHEEELKDRRYVSLDDFAQLEAARRDPEAFVAPVGPVTIDEVQKCPELLTAIKREVDRRREPGRFLLSGSANLALLRGVTESLAGRAAYFTLWPFTRRELAGLGTREPFLRTFFADPQLPRGGGSTIEDGDVLRGGMPSVCLGEVRQPALWFKGYEQTYLERDVRDLSRIGDLITFRQLLRLAALRTGQILKVSELGRDAKINTSTAGRYLSLMEASYVLHRVAPYLGNRASRLIKSPKIYVSDAGLAAHLCGLEPAASIRDDPLRGALFETYAAQNLAALLEAGWPAARLGFWHVQGRYEVDFVVEAGHDSMAIEIKSSGRWNDRDTAGLRALLDGSARCRAAILAHNGPAAVRLSERLWAIPLATVLS